VLGLNSMAAMMVQGASVYVVLNTGLVSLVISLAEARSIKEVWPCCYEWTFPYFLVGAVVAGLASAAGHATNRGVPLLVVHIFRAVLDNISSASQEDEALLARASQGR
jgi:hypothetical protein